MPNPLQRLKGGITQVKNSAKSIDLAKNVKGGTAQKVAATAKMGPGNIAKAFVTGAKNPGEAKKQAGFIKSISSAQKEAKIQSAGMGNAKGGPGLAKAGTTVSTSKPVQPKPTPAPKAKLSPDAKAKLMKQNLNNAFPGLNMK